MVNVPDDLEPVEPVDIGDVSVEKIIEVALERGLFYFDLETTGLNPRRDRIEGIAIYIPPTNIIDEIGRLHAIEDGRPIGVVREGPALRAWLPFVPDTMRVAHRSKSNPKKIVYVSLRDPLDQRETMEKLRPLFETHTKVVGIAHNAKFDGSFMIHSPGADRPYRLNLRLGDSMLLDFLGEENSKQYGLKHRVKLLLGYEMTTYEDVAKYRRQLTLPFMAGRIKPIGAYAMEDCVWGYNLFVKGYRRIMEEDESGVLEKIYWKIDMEVCKIIEEMESAGVLIDWRWLRKVSAKLEDEKDDILSKIEERLGYGLNPKSAPQVSDLLFSPKDRGGLGLSIKAVPYKEGGGHYATGSKEIGHLKRADKLVEYILKWRSLDTVQSSFAIKIANIVQEDPEGRLHAKFNQTGTQIFRLSSSDPVNFQNQPRNKKLIRKAFCAHLPEEPEIIKAIENAEERKRREDELLILFGADYSQIELRVAAHLSGDANMIEVYRMVGGCKADDGKPCARYKIWVCEECDKKDRPSKFTPPDDVTPDRCPNCGSDNIEHQKRCRHVDIHQRTSEDVKVPRNPLAKNLNFGSLYRIGPDRFCQYADLYDENGDPRVDYAREVLDGWFSAYSAIRPFHQETENYLRKNNWVAQTLTGRRHRLWTAKLENEYEAVTKGIQFQVSGSAQDIIKMAMIHIVQERVRKISQARPAERKLWKKFRFLLQVHDEIVLEGPHVLRYEIKDLIERNMRGAASLRIPLESTAKFGQSWDDIH